jgi:tRNA(Arg) A34 adenosine deaminase TadA
MAKQRYSVVAICYDRKGKVLSVGRNSYTKTHPIQAHFARKVGHPAKHFLHAEVDAILKARGKSIAKIQVVRYDKDGQPALSKPCLICQEAIKAFGIQIVEHT